MTSQIVDVVTRVRLAITIRNAALAIVAGTPTELLVRYRGRVVTLTSAPEGSGELVVSLPGWHSAYDATSASTHDLVIDTIVPDLEAALCSNQG